MHLESNPVLANRHYIANELCINLKCAGQSGDGRTSLNDRLGY